MAKKITIVFPSLPPSELMPNASKRLHWGIKSPISLSCKSEAWYRARNMLGSNSFPLKKASIKYIFRSKTKRVRDLDGLIVACKPWLDGLVAAGVITDDSGWILRIAGAELVKADKDDTILEIRADA